MRTIAAFTGTRAEYGLLRPVLRQLQDRCTLQLIVSGTHLSDTHGNTVAEILHDGFTPAATIPLDLQETTAVSICNATGHLIAAMGEALHRLRPDCLLVLGDRYETFAAAAAATLSSIPVAHLYGGEITQGAVDDALRHAVSKLSHLHFTSCEAYRQRVIQLGESPERVWNVGALGVENVQNLPLWGEPRIRADLGFPPSLPYFVATFHPVTLEAGQEQAQLDAILSALDAFPDYGIVFTGANADTGGNSINLRLQEWAKQSPDLRRFVPSLGVVRYLSAVHFAAAVLGNSSSGVLELPSLGVPVVDIGSRQAGRLRSTAVLHCPPETNAIVCMLQQALSPAHRSIARDTPNPYEQSGTSERIVEILATISSDTLQIKEFYDLPVESSCL